jgi:hypothetical protein
LEKLGKNEVSICLTFYLHSKAANYFHSTSKKDLALKSRIFITAGQRPAGTGIDPHLLPERQDFIPHLSCLSGSGEEIVSSASCASLACGYENIAFQAAVLRDSFERRFLKQYRILDAPPDGQCTKSCRAKYKSNKSFPAIETKSKKAFYFFCK